MKWKLLLMLLVVVQISQAQTLSEWLEQKKTQKEYLFQQIAALQIYFDYAKKGYEIGTDGLRTINDIKNGDFKLHETFFGSLNKVNPKISKAVKVVTILKIQIDIIKTIKQCLINIKDLSEVNIEELNYCRDVFEDLLDDCLQTIDWLIIILAPTIQMTDDERITRLDGIYNDLRDKQGFSLSFWNSVRLLSIQRLIGKSEVDGSKHLNDIK